MFQSMYIVLLKTRTTLGSNFDGFLSLGSDWNKCKCIRILYHLSAKKQGIQYHDDTMKLCQF